MSTIEFLRQFRLGGYAIFDFIAAFLWMYLIAPLLSRLFLRIWVEIPKINWLFLTLPIWIIVHILVWDITLFTKDFLNLNGNYIVKILVIISLVLWLRGIRLV
jgi:hypothetical protein